MDNAVSEKEGRLLLKIARQEISRCFGKEKSPAGKIDVTADMPALNAYRGSFVTLHKQGALRGCIGTIVPEKPLFEDVKDNAVHAAFNDSRFRPLTGEELNDIHIEVSILTPLQTLEYDGATGLISKLRPGIDGVMIKKNGYQATFLPQVWEQLPAPQSFLGQLCLKAGLPENEWQSGTLDVQVYQVQFFEES